MAKSICEHIRNVKSSLENAEKSFRENNGMRGELDLMLAEAEIKHLREKRGWVSVWTRQRLALLAAAIVVLAGYGGWLYAGTDRQGYRHAKSRILYPQCLIQNKNVPWHIREVTCDNLHLHASTQIFRSTVFLYCGFYTGEFYYGCRK